MSYPKHYLFNSPKLLHCQKGRAVIFLETKYKTFISILSKRVYQFIETNSINPGVQKGCLKKMFLRLKRAVAEQNARC